MKRLIILAALAPSLAHADSAPTTTNCACPPKPATVVVDKGAAARTQARWLAAAGTTLVVASAAFAMRAERQYEDFEIELDTAKHRMQFASGLFLGGAVALGVAAYRYFGKGRERAVVATPVITPDRVGMALARRF